MTLATAQPKEFFLTDDRIDVNIQTLNYKVIAIDELGNRRLFNILVPYYVQLNDQIEKFLRGATGCKWTVLTKEIIPQSEDVVEQAQSEFESYLDSMVEEIAADPVTEAEDYMLSCGYDAKAMLVCTHTRLYRMYVKGKLDAIAYCRDTDLLAACKQWVRCETVRKEHHRRHLQAIGVA